MRDYRFVEDEEQQAPCLLGQQNEKDTRLLFNAYFALITTFKKLSEQFMQGAYTDGPEQFNSAAKTLFEKTF